MNKSTRYIQKSCLDQFYTSTDTANLCYDTILKRYDLERFDILFEPSAGTGSFFSLFPKSKRIGIDLDPKIDEIEKLDFFDFIPPTDKKIATIGNPPFGKIASLAIKFFNKSAQFSDIIAFIIPKTFRKKSVQNKLCLNFRLKLDIDLPKNSFVLDGQPYNVPCCFQIWERSKTKRRIVKVKLENEYFDFVKKSDADFAVRRVGGTTGKATSDILDCAEVSFYFLKTKKVLTTDRIIENINNIDFTKIINSTAGVKSLSKPEFVVAFLRTIKKRNER